jgi:predicted nucleic acid-binding protein
LIVVDASWLIDWLLGRPAALEMIETEARAEHEPLQAPELIEPEALNGLRGLVARGDISEHRAAEALGDLAETRLVLHSHAPLRDRVWDLRDVLTAYDAVYLALAETLPDAVLLTGDRGLAGVAVRSLGPSGVRLVTV